MRIRTKQVAYRASPEHKLQLAELSEWWSATGQGRSQADVLHDLVSDEWQAMKARRSEAVKRIQRLGQEIES